MTQTEAKDALIASAQNTQSEFIRVRREQLLNALGTVEVGATDEPPVEER
jgi:hypothetical protein